MPQEYGDHWISDFLQAIPISQAAVRHSGPTNPQVKGFDQTREALVKIISMSPPFLDYNLLTEIQTVHPLRL
jgi:hypothetical protein